MLREGFNCSIQNTDIN